MDNLNLDKIIEIVNEEKNKRGLEDYIPLYPMLRLEDNKLYIGIMLSHQDDKIWDIDSSLKTGYWALLDINSLDVIEINNIEEKNYILDDIIDNKRNSFVLKELAEYEVRKKIEYQEYLMNDIKMDELPIQKKLARVLNNELEVDGEKVNIQDYIMANIETELKEKVKELVDLLVQSKYSSITFYYETLYNQIVREYKENNILNKDKMLLCIEIMNNYYYGIVGIDNFFNI